MDTTEAEANLKEQRGKLKQKFASLMDDHILFEEGRKEEMIGKKQVMLDQTKRVLQKIVTKL